MAEKYSNGVAFLGALISSENIIREEAENYINVLKANNKALLFSYCKEGLQQSNVGLIQMALFIIKKYFVTQKDEIPEGETENINKYILSLAQNHSAKILLNIGADIVCKRAIHNKTQAALVQELTVVCQSPDPSLRKFGLIAFESLAAGHLDSATIEANAPSFLGIFSGLLADSDVQVRMEAVKTTSTFLAAIGNADVLIKSDSIISRLIAAMIEALKNDEDEGKAALESLTSLTEMQPDIWNNYLSDITVICSQIITTPKFKDETRGEAIELLLTLSEEKKTEIRKLTEIKTMFFPALLQMLAESKHKDNIEAWTADEEDDETESDPASTAYSAISRLAAILGGKAIMALCDAHLASYLQNANWMLRSAGLLCVGAIAEAAKEVMKKKSTMQTLNTTLIPFLEDSHIRVKHSAISAFSNICDQLSPTIQKRHHKILIESMMRAMQNDNIKVQAEAVSCMVNFCKGIVDQDNNILETYASNLLDTLAKLFELSLAKNYMPLQSEVLSCMSMIASVIKSKFADYYRTFIPGLTRLLAVTPSATMRHKELRANTIKTIGSMLYAMSETKENKVAIAAEVKLITNGLVSLLGSKMTEDDPQLMAIYNFLGEVTYVLESEFGEYLPKVIPQLFAYAKTEIKAKVSDSQNPAAKTETSDFVLNVAGINLSVNTQSFQSKVMAANVLLEICGNTRKAFRPYAEEMLEIVISFLNTRASGTLRRTGAKCVKCLLLTCETKEEMLKFFSFAYPAMRDAVLYGIKSANARDIKSILKELYGIIREYSDRTTVLSNEGMLDLCDILGKCLECYSKLHKEAMNSLKKGKTLDEEDIEDIKSQLDFLGKLVTQVMLLAGQLGKIFGLQCEDLFVTRLMPHFVSFWEHPSPLSPREELSALCFFCDFLEYMHGAKVHGEVAKQTGTKFVLALSSPDRDVLQSAVYGIGVIAMHAPAQFTEIKAIAVPAVIKIITSPDSMKGNNKIATECAIGALGKIVLFNYDGSLINHDTAKTYLNLLPLIAEPEEAQDAHNLLITQSMKKNPAVFSSLMVATLKSALLRIQEKYKLNPELKVLKESDAPLIQECLSLLSS